MSELFSDSAQSRLSTYTILYYLHNHMKCITKTEEKLGFIVQITGCSVNDKIDSVWSHIDELNQSIVKVHPQQSHRSLEIEKTGL